MSYVQAPGLPARVTNDAVFEPRADVAQLAYLRWMERGCPAGSDLQDWLEAERDVKGRSTRVESDTSSAASELAEFFENAAMPLHWIGSDGTILWANRAELELLGYARSEYFGRHIAEFHLDAAVIDDMLERLARGEPLRLREARLCCKDGSVRHVLISSDVLWRGGAFIHTRCFTKDITEQRRLECALLDSETWSRAVLDAAVDAILIVNHEGQVVDLNRSAEAMFGFARDAILGQPIAELIVPPALQNAFRGGFERAAQGEGDSDFFGPREQMAQRRDATTFPALISIIQVAGTARPRFAAFIRDLTAQKSAEHRTAAEHAVLRALSESSLSSEVGERTLAALGLHLAWDVGAIWMLDADMSELRCTSFWSRSDAAAPRFEEHTREITLTRGVGLAGRAWDTGLPVWASCSSEDHSFLRRESALEEGLLTAFAFPIGGRAGLLGVIEFLSREFHEPDNGLLETMGRIGAQIGQFVERRRVEESLCARQRELDCAREIQMRLLPQASPVQAGYAIAAMSHPAQETGGDYYDFLRLPGRGIGIAIGDASGHGVGAALVIAETRAYLRAFAVIESDPGRLLARANRCLAEDLAEGFVTMFLARLDPAERSLTYASAGHWPGYLFNRAGELKAQLPSTGIPLGLDSKAKFATSPAMRLEAGDVLLLLTDGIIEATSPDGDLFGAGAVFDVVRESDGAPPDLLLVSLFARVTAFDGGRVTDDRTAVVIQVLDDRSQPA